MTGRTLTLATVALVPIQALLVVRRSFVAGKDPVQTPPSPHARGALSLKAARPASSSSVLRPKSYTCFLWRPGVF